MCSHANSDLSPASAREFATTHWTVVLTAGRSDSTHARAALAQLCEVYWYPLYAFVRRQGYRPHDAQDLTQGFFARLLEKQFLGLVERSKGRFRSFLLAALKHFLANERDRAQAQKRGGGQILISFWLLDYRSAAKWKSSAFYGSGLGSLTLAKIPLKMFLRCTFT